MPYLPASYLHETELPAAFDRDVRTTIQMIDEQAKRMFPKIRYYSLKLEVGIAGTDPVTGGPAPIGLSGQGTYDELYGEQVDPAMTGEWVQPHLNADVEATVTEIERHEDPVEIHARVQRDAKDRDLKKWGFDEMRDLLVHIPTASLDKLGITVLPGDKFVWDGDEYAVLQSKDTGHWKNTNMPLWLTIMAEHKRRGS